MPPRTSAPRCGGPPKLFPRGLECLPFGGGGAPRLGGRNSFPMSALTLRVSHKLIHVVPPWVGAHDPDIEMLTACSRHSLGVGRISGEIERSRRRPSHSSLQSELQQRLRCHIDARFPNKDEPSALKAGRPIESIRCCRAEAACIPGGVRFHPNVSLTPTWCRKNER